MKNHCHRPRKSTMKSTFSASGSGIGLAGRRASGSPQETVSEDKQSRSGEGRIPIKKKGIRGRGRNKGERSRGEGRLELFLLSGKLPRLGKNSHKERKGGESPNCGSRAFPKKEGSYYLYRKRKSPSMGSHQFMRLGQAKRKNHKGKPKVLKRAMS